MKFTWKNGSAPILVLICLLMAVGGCASSPAENDPPVSAITAQNDSTAVSTANTNTTNFSTSAFVTQQASLTTRPTSIVSKTTAASSVSTTQQIQQTQHTARQTAPTKTTSSAHYVHSAGKVFQNMTFSYNPLPEAVVVSGKYGYQDLGTMQLEEYPIDGVYDQAFNCIKVGDTYKMWWCRACPMDTIWYAESKDMKNWYNARCCIDLKGIETVWIKQMMAWPSVLYIDGIYHMFFEAPANIGESGEYNNNIFYATSPDGMDWTFYPNNKNPQPVIKNPNVREGVYGVGQPKAFYMDGAFYVVYTDASTGGGDIRVAKSVGNGYSFTGTVASHDKLLSGIAGAAVRYNEATGKYYMVIAADANSGSKNSMGIYMQESDDLFKWPYSTAAQMKIKGNVLAEPSDITKKGNPDFVTNERGIVTGENMIFMYMDGVMPGSGSDHRVTHTTWDGRLGVLTTGSLFGKTPLLPNGKSATSENLIWYQDLVGKWVRPSIVAASGTPTIDGIMDSVYGNSGTAMIESVTWAYNNCKPTDTTGLANFVWDADALYMYATIKDNTPLTAGSISENDSITIFVNVPAATSGKTTADTYWLTVDAAGHYQAWNAGGKDITSSLGGLTVKVRIISGGYVVELKLPWYAPIKSKVSKGSAISLDLRITDDIGMVRNAQVYWSDYAAGTENLLDRYGSLKLQ